ncbi:hypothetical protein [Salinigranum marinum]|uniref:hypothetical protein n=1 Tax=Salinigranum marinum TaxID=1515595 RepID=UPI002989CDA8|nr:hypothetical protein [Salinigranum marinum]
MSSRTVVAFALVVLVGSTLAGTAAAVPDARLTVSDVTVTPGTPVTDAPVTVSVTVSNGGGSPQAVAVDEVQLVEGDDVIARSLEPGSLSAGGTLTVPLTTSFSEPGERSLSVHVRGRDEDGDTVDVRRPLSVAVEAAPPLVELDTTELVAGSETQTPVVVSNPTTEPVRNVVVSLSTDNGEAVVDRRTVASLAAGAEQQLNFSVRAATPGAATLAVEVGYTTGSGTRATETYDHPVTVEELVDDVGVRVATAPTSEESQQPAAGQLGVLLGGNTGGATQQTDDDEESSSVAVTVTNFGNAPITDVVATPHVGETTLARVGVPGPLAPGEEQRVTVPLDRAPGGDLVVDVSYDVGSGTSNATGRFDFRPQAGAVRITGVDIGVDDNGTVQVSGNAGNVGRGSVTGLVVAVGDAPDVEPAYPQRDYFVGTVEGSEFAPFELTANVGPNASSIPVVVTYAVDGDIREETVSLPLSDEITGEQRSDRSLPLSVWLGVVGVAMAAAAAVVIRTR